MEKKKLNPPNRLLSLSPRTHCLFYTFCPQSNFIRQSARSLLREMKKEAEEVEAQG